MREEVIVPDEQVQTPSQKDAEYYSEDQACIKGWLLVIHCSLYSYLLPLPEGEGWGEGPLPSPKSRGGA